MGRPAWRRGWDWPLALKSEPKHHLWLNGLTGVTWNSASDFAGADPSSPIGEPAVLHRVINCVYSDVHCSQSQSCDGHGAGWMSCGRFRMNKRW